LDGAELLNLGKKPAAPWISAARPDDLDPLRLVEVFREIGAWLLDRCGLVITMDESSFARRRNKRGPADDSRPHRLRRSTGLAVYAEGEARSDGR
jgi:hypothetical protein